MGPLPKQGVPIIPYHSYLYLQALVAVGVCLEYSLLSILLLQLLPPCKQSNGLLSVNMTDKGQNKEGPHTEGQDIANQDEEIIPTVLEGEGILEPNVMKVLVGGGKGLVLTFDY